MTHSAIALPLLISLTACTSTNFTRTGFDRPPPVEGACDAVVLQSPPSERKFIEVGICTTSVAGGGVITDSTPKAIRELQQCACTNGGNAVLLQGDSEAGMQTAFGYSQQRVKASATVLYVFPLTP